MFVLVRFFFRLAIRNHFFGPLGCLLAPFWGVFGLVLGHLGLFWARFGALRAACCNPLTLYAHQLINASTLQPVARQHLETRAGGLRAERLNLPSCERKAAQSNVFRYLETSFTCYAVLFVIFERLLRMYSLYLFNNVIFTKSS